MKNLVQDIEGLADTLDDNALQPFVDSYVHLLVTTEVRAKRFHIYDLSLTLESVIEEDNDSKRTSP